jgi:hypothetical protein
MKIRAMLLAVAATFALSAAAFAGDKGQHDSGHPTSRQQMTASCSVLESQYDKLIEGRMNEAKADKAEGLHAQGVSDCDCNSNNSGIGVQKLERAVRDLGAKPAA